jgi:hypothetical protein
VRYAFEKQDVIDLDSFTPHRLLYWIVMKSNSLEISKFVARYYKRKYSNDSFWISIFKREGLLQ